MMIDFDDLENKKEAGARMFSDGASIGLHTHETSSEIINFVKGAGKMRYDGAFEKIHSGLFRNCPKGHAHSMVNDGDEELIFFAAVPEQ